MLVWTLAPPHVPVLPGPAVVHYFLTGNRSRAMLLWTLVATRSKYLIVYRGADGSFQFDKSYLYFFFFFFCYTKEQNEIIRLH